MTTRFMGVDSVAPQLPATVKVPAGQTTIIDTGSHFTATDVEGALTELAVGAGDLTQATADTRYWLQWVGTQAAYDALGSYAANTLYVIIG